MRRSGTYNFTNQSHCRVMILLTYKLISKDYTILESKSWHQIFLLQVNLRAVIVITTPLTLLNFSPLKAITVYNNIIFKKKITEKSYFGVRVVAKATKEVLS